MNKSESIDQLCVALSLTQSQMRGAVKDSENPFYKSKYADLQSIWEAIRDPLTKNGLSISQLTDTNGAELYLETILLHKSGQWVSGRIPVLMKERSAQAMGSAITYARRYALAAIVGIYQEDDDGDAATKPSLADEIYKPFEKKPVITDKQAKRLWMIAKEHGWSEADLKDHLFSEYNLESMRDIKTTDYESICMHVEKNPGALKALDRLPF